MDSLLATYASSSSDDDDEEAAAEQQRRRHHHHSKPPPSSSSTSSSSSSSSFFTYLPPPKLPPSSSSTSSPTFFTSLPPPKSPSSSSSPAPPPMALQSTTSKLPSLLPLPPSKKIVQFRPAIFDAKFVHEDDDDEEDKARAALKKKSSSTIISSSNLSSLLPPPKTSLGSSFSSSRKSSVDNQSNHLPAPRVSTEPAPISLAPTEIDVSSFRNQERTADAVVAEPSWGFEGNPEDEGNLDPNQQSYQEYYYNYYYANQGAVEEKAEYDTWAGDASAVEGVSVIGEGKERKRGRNDIAEKVIEVNQEELMKSRPRQDQVKLTGIAFGQDHQPSTGSWKPSKLHRRKHQIGSLFFDMKQKSTELAERRAKGLLTKAQTQGKYGW